MAFSLSFSELDEKVQNSYVDLSQKILALDAELVKISEERAEQEAVWRKKENYIQTEKGKLELSLRALRTATLSETAE
jgi:hypothetical protein